VCLDAPSYIHLAYRPGVPLIAEVVKTGRPTVKSLDSQWLQ
jgi:imidazolonepropionase